MASRRSTEQGAGIAPAIRGVTKDWCPKITPCHRTSCHRGAFSFFSVLCASPIFTHLHLLHDLPVVRVCDVLQQAIAKHVREDCRAKAGAASGGVVTPKFAGARELSSRAGLAQRWYSPNFGVLKCLFSPVMFCGEGLMKHTACGGRKTGGSREGRPPRGEGPASLQAHLQMKHGLPNLRVQLLDEHHLGTGENRGTGH